MYELLQKPFRPSSIKFPEKKFMGNHGNAFLSFGNSVVGGWKELGRTTLGSAGDDITVSSLPNKRYYMILNDMRATGNIIFTMRYNGDTGTNYAYRQSPNGGADGTGVSATATEPDGIGSTTTPKFAVGYLANYSTKEKLDIFSHVAQMTAGAGTACGRCESVSKWANTSDSISSIINHNRGTGDFDTGSEVVVLGWSPNDTHTTNFWEELASVNGTGSSTTLSTGTFTAKKYLWVQAYCSGGHAGGEDIQMTFNNDTAGNYAYRRSINGGADVTGVSQSNLSNPMAGDGVKSFMNMFVINNSANEKLCINHLVEQGTAGAGNAPNRREHAFKWANTSSQITEIDFKFSGSTNWGTGSIIKVWGSD